MPEEGPRRVGVHLLELRRAGERRLDRAARMGGIVHRRAEHRDDRVADVLVDEAALRLDDVGHRRQVAVHHLHELVRGQPLGQRGEARDVGEENGDLALLAAQLWRGLSRHQPVDHRGREVELEAAPQQALVLVRDREAEAEQRRAAGARGEQGRHEGPGDAGMEGHDAPRRPGEGEGGEGEARQRRGQVEREARRGGDEQRRRGALAGAAELGKPAAAQQVVDEGPLDHHAGDRVAHDVVAQDVGPRRQRAARPEGRALGAGHEAPRTELAVLDVEDRAEKDDPAPEMALEEFRVALRRAGMEVGEREGRDVRAAPLEVEQEVVGRRARDPSAREEHAAIARLGRRAERARGELKAERGLLAGPAGRLPVLDVEQQRRAADDLVGVAEEVGRADVRVVVDREALAAIGPDRRRAVLHLAEHDAPVARAGAQRAQEVAVMGGHEALDRGREDDVEADHGRAGVERRLEHGGDVARPEGLGHALEGRRPVGLLVDRDHGDARRVRPVPRPEGRVAQREGDVERQAAQRIEQRRRHQAGADRDDRDRRAERPAIHRARLRGAAAARPRARGPAARSGPP